MKHNEIILENQAHPRLAASTTTNANNGTAQLYVDTGSGYIKLGPANTSHCHIQTDRSNFYFDKELRVDSGVIGSYNEDLYLRRATNSSHQIQISTTSITNSLPTTVNGVVTWTGGNSTNANTAYGWGNHASAGYLTAVPAKASPVTSTELGAVNLDDYAQQDDAGFYHQLANSDATNGSNWPNNRAGSLLVQKGANHQGYGTTQLFIDYNNSDVYVRSMYGSTSANRAWVKLYDTSDFTNNSTNWNTAYGWGDHSTQGYITDGNTNWNNTYGFITNTSGTAKGVNQSYVASSSSTSNRGNYGAGVWAYSGYSTGSNRPFTYDATLQVMPASNMGFEFSVDWLSQSSTPLKVRSLRDCCQGWSDYSTVWTSTTDGANSGLDADLLDGQHGSFYLNAGNMNAGTLPEARLPTISKYLRSDANDSFTGQLTMSTQKALIASNYGHGVYGVYSASKYQHVWSMGTGYNGPANGASTGTVGNLYGLAWTYNPDHGGTGNNAQAKAGLNHQLLLTMNGITYTALGNGIWTSGNISRNGNTVWDAGNDGPNSGLDADTVDGKHASDFMEDQFLDSAYVDFTVNGDADTYYPVSIRGGGVMAFQMYSISRQYNWTAPNTWNTSTHRGGLTLTWQYSGDGFWGGNDHDVRIIKWDETYSTMVAGMQGSVGGGGTNAGVVVWLRGGGALYRFHGPQASAGDVNIHLSSVTASNSTVFAPRSLNTTTRDNELLPKYPIRNQSELYDNNNRVWHAGNDGPGSGLDADTVDGQGESVFMRKSANSELDMNNYNVNYVNQLHFNANVRFYDDDNDSYLNFKYGDAGPGGFKMIDGSGNLDGYFYADGGNIGILPPDGGWGLRVSNSDCESYHNFRIPAGSATAPSLTTSADTNTGVFMPGSDVFKITTGGVNALTVNNSDIQLIRDTVSVKDYLRHYGDTDTYFRFTGDRIRMVAGNVTFMDATEGATDYLRFPTRAVTIGSNTNPQATFTIDQGCTETPANGCGTGNDAHMKLENTNTTGSASTCIIFNAKDSGGNMRHGAGIQFKKAIAWSANGQYPGELYFWTRPTSGNQAAAQKLDKDGNAIFKGNVTAYGSLSDRRLKENIENIPDATKKVQKLNGVTFNYKKDGKKATGLIAQELQEVLPEAVYTSENIETGEEHLAIHYGNVIGLLVESIKELKAEIEDLKNDKH